MENRRLIFGLFLVLLIFSVTNVSAELNDSLVNKAYSCLQNKTQNCSTSLDENIFTLLSLKTCEAQVLNASSSTTQCWPKSSCNLVQTSKALLALENANSDTTKGLDWILSKQAVPTNLEWYLQIETNEASSCSVKYSGYSPTINLAEDKKVSMTGTNPCLSVSENEYWLKISSSTSCQNYTYTISCENDFKTNTLFKQTSSDIIHISSNLDSSSENGETTAKINSSCFSDSTSCSYEGTLWASLFLNYLKKDVTPYLPYLITMAENNSRYLPEAFLYMFAGESYKSDLLIKQINNKYWEESGDRYFDTALALLALQSTNDLAKENSIDWLMETQDSQGCWQGNVRNTGFILYSIAPRNSITPGTGTTKPDCETSGFSCLSSIGCSTAGGTVLDNYQCASSFLQCCSSPPITSTCLEKAGILCNSNQQCVGGTTASSSDSVSGATCCLGGACIIKDVDDEDEEKENACEIAGGICRSVNCQSGESSDSTLTCDFSSQTCCVTTKSSTNYLWIWILLILIVLSGIGIIFRDKLREFWFRIFHSRPKSSPPFSGSREYNPMHMIPRRIIPSSRPSGPAPVRRNSGELDDVLKKLKDLSK